MYMKAIQVMISDALLQRLDASEEVKQKGRSAVIREALASHLQQRRQAKIREAYRAGYGEDSGLGTEFEGWEEEGVWPEE